jgi:hypothetical protein
MAPAALKERNMTRTGLCRLANARMSAINSAAVVSMAVAKSAAPYWLHCPSGVIQQPRSLRAFSDKE